VFRAAPDLSDVRLWPSDPRARQVLSTVRDRPRRRSRHALQRQPIDDCLRWLYWLLKSRAVTDLHVLGPIDPASLIVFSTAICEKPSGRVLCRTDAERAPELLELITASGLDWGVRVTSETHPTGPIGPSDALLMIDPDDLAQELVGSFARALRSSAIVAALWTRGNCTDAGQWADRLSRTGTPLATMQMNRNLILGTPVGC